VKRRLSPWPHRVLYAVGLVVLGVGFYLAYVVNDMKALGPFGAVGGAALILAISDHLTYRRLGGGRR
jgi:hypothetical protein